MWAMLQAAGAVLAKFGAKHPAVKWAVIALVGLFAVEFVAKEAIDVWVKLETARATVTRANADAAKAEVETRAATHQAPGAPSAAPVASPVPPTSTVDAEARAKMACAVMPDGSELERLRKQNCEGREFLKIMKGD